MESTAANSPVESGYRMPAEWETHAATWLAWPHNRETWPENLAAARDEFCLLVDTICQSEAVVLLCPQQERDSWHRLIKPENSRPFPIELLVVQTNDAWVRDYGPTFVTKERNLLAIDWRYNGWGAKYPPFDDDQKVVQRAVLALSDLAVPSEQLQGPSGIQIHTSELCIEGGAIETDGQGTLMCTTTCALNTNRNQDWTQQQVERELLQCLGGDSVVWLKGEGLEGDDTDGHIDQIARFLPGGKIVYAWTDRGDSQYPALCANITALQKSSLIESSSAELVPLPVPQPVMYRGQRMPASYCNFYITNQQVIVPQFDQPAADAEAIAILQQQFGTERQVIGLPSSNLITGLGSFHCLTQQQPAVQ